MRYVKSGIFSSEISSKIGEAFEIRNKSDDEDMYVISKNLANEQVNNAEQVVKAVEMYLKARIE